MREDISVRISDAYGVHLQDLSIFGSMQGAALDYVLNVGKPSACTLAVPANVMDESIFKLDGRIGIWRSPGGYGPFLDGDAQYLIRKWKYSSRLTTVTAYHANSILNRRFVLYDKSSSFASKTTATPADDLVKEIWSENAGPLISSDRDGDEIRADISSIVQIQGDGSASASVEVQAGRRSVVDVIEEVTKAAALTGGYLAVEIVASGEGALELRTFPTARGDDRRVTTDAGLIFSEGAGTLANVELIVDRSNEKTFIVAVGAGDDANRLVQTASNVNRRDASPLNRIEHVIPLSNVADDLQLFYAARAELRNFEPLIYITAEIPEASPLIRGIDYDYGDLISAEVRGQRYDCRLDMIRTTIGHDNRSTQVVLRSLST